LDDVEGAEIAGKMREDVELEVKKEENDGKAKL
jgi:hypothetical protein